jgi:dCMP deaminase
MILSQMVGQRSHHPVHKVGCIIVSGDNTQVLSIGYNGNYKGGSNQVDSTLPGLSGLIHAEVNALLKMDYNSNKPKIMYVTLSPCVMCAKAIINAGIDKVYYLQAYRDTEGLELLKRAGIEVEGFQSKFGLLI